MKKLGLKTCREELKKLIDSKILQKEGYDIDCLFDMNTELWGTKYHGVDIVSPFEAMKRYRAGQIDKIIIPAATVRHDLNDKYLDEQLKFGVKKEDILYSSVELWGEENCPEHWLLSCQDYNYLDYLEFHTNDHCNLNCKNCNNYSNLVQSEVFTDYGQFAKDVSRLKVLVSHIHVIRILGGEPLLNKETYRFVKLMREKYPYAELRIVTNGTLLLQVDERLANTMLEENAMFEISAYPILYDKMDTIAAYLHEKGIRFKIGWIANRFNPPLIHEYGYPLKTVDCNCIHMRNGKLARCPLVQYLDYYNAAHGTDYDGSDGIIDLYDTELTFSDLWKRINTSFSLCNRCGFWRKDLPGETWCRG